MLSASVQPIASGDVLKGTSTVFNHKATEFGERFNRVPFAVSHNLAGDPLFALPRLVELAKTLWTLGGAKVLFHEGEASFDNRWEEIPRKSLSFIEGIIKIQNSGSWVLLKSIQEDPEYKVCMDRCLGELSVLTGVNLQEEITWMEGYIFIASPGAVTPHHIDHESNFLLQVHGEKDLNVCDPNDRSVLFDEEIESYYMGDLSAAAYKPVSQEKAYVFPMAPGRGVHIPSKGPHWVRNGSQYSVSFSLNFCMRELDIKARVYQFNHFLRKLNFTPTPPGKSAMKDRLKIASLGRLRRGKRAANKYELLRQNVIRLERASRLAEKFLKRSASSQKLESSAG
jgi:hypothetical protein